MWQQATLSFALGCIGAAMLWRSPVAAQPPAAFDPSLFRELTWRHIGPFRGGPTQAVAGVPSQPNVFYIGAADGGIWKTDDYGGTWTPIFDDQPNGSIGALAVAPSNPNVVYAGGGEGLQRPDLSVGDGIYKSIDAGRTWTHLGLRDGQQIPEIAIDPRDPNRLFVAVLGHPYGPNEERGIFRSTDGGRTFSKVLYKDPDTGGADVALDPADPQTVYAALWQARCAPWETGAFTGPGSGLFKSTDGGATWRPIMNGLPTFAADGLGRIGIAVAPSLPQRLFATVAARSRGGLYRSDDAGATWRLASNDPRVTQGQSDVAEVKVDPKQADVVYTASAAAWKSVDGGRTFAVWRGAPGGGEYRRLWINPNDTNTMLLAGDQGAAVTVNGGRTWSSRYNQQTAQFSQVATDTAFPYRVCGVQQQSGSACVSSRSDDGRITERDWHPVGPGKDGYIAPDPLDPDVVYGGHLSRYDRRTGQTQDVLPPRDPAFRMLGAAPLLFSTIDPRTLFFAANTVWKTVNGGQNWTAISPDLARDTFEMPASVGVYRTSAEAQPTRRGAISALSLSPIDQNLIWAGTNDGLIHVTRDGGRTWTPVTPPQIGPWASISMLAASHFDVNTAYAAVDAARLDDLRPYIYRTRDGGRSWTVVTNGLPEDAPIHTVKEDPHRRGLLFAGTDRAVCVSFDDGDRWQSLRLNMPATSVRDLVIKDDDLAVATHGRGFWVLDDITPLRQITADIVKADVFLFRPSTAWRFRSNEHTSAPLPSDEPAAPNPPDGVVISYLIGPNARGPVTLEILETTSGTLIRRYSSDAPDDPPAARLSADAGLHRFVWDVRFAPPAVETLESSTGAAPHDTPETPRGMLVLPGTYQVRLTVGDRVYRQAVLVKTDPRVKASPADLTAQFNLSKALDDAIRELHEARRTLAARQRSPSGDAVQLHAIATALDEASSPMPALFTAIQAADAKPTAALEAAITAALEHAAEALARYKDNNAG